jgi:hypothetical protein
MKKILMQALINTELGATNANALKDVHDHGMKLNVIDGTSQTIVSEVTGAAMIALTAGAADFSIFENTHARVKEATDFRFISFMRRLRRDFDHGTALNFLRREDAELHAYYGFDVRRMLIETGWHSVLEIEIVV